MSQIGDFVLTTKKNLKTLEELRDKAYKLAKIIYEDKHAPHEMCSLSVEVALGLNKLTTEV